jgi:hypothetical protein
MKTMMAIAVGVALATMGMIEGVARAEPVPANTLATGACATHAASIYFARNAVELNSWSRQIVARLAADAKACGRSQVFADAPDGALKPQRAAAISKAFAANGVQAVLVHVSSTSTAPLDESVLDRAAAVRVQIAPPNS